MVTERERVADRAKRESVAEPARDLVDAARRGDATAFRAIVLHYDEGLRSLAFRLLGDRDRMDDVLQEVYLRAYRALPKFREDSRLWTWLYRITYNACVDELRRARRWRGPTFQEDEASLHDLRPAPGDLVTDRVMLEKALAEVDPHLRAVVLLVDGQGFDYKAAAEVLGVAPGTVGSRLHRARAALRRSLEEEGSTDES